MLTLLPLFAMALQTTPMKPISPKGYVCQRASSPIVLDGKLDDAAWSKAPWTDDFVDIEGDIRPKPRFRTRAKMLWDETNLYIGAEMEEPQVRATLTEHDSVIFRDNDFEVFLDPDGDCTLYSELELNAFNTTWDLLLVKPYRAGGPPIDGWEIKGLKTAVHVDGKINDPAHTDRGWSVEIAIPWASLAQIAGCPCPPKDGDQWRINFSRVEWQVETVDGKYRTVLGTHEDNWVWSPQHVVDMHRPEHWGILQFTKEQAPVPLTALDGADERSILIEAWEAELAFREKHGIWCDSPSDLGLHYPGLELHVTPSLFECAYGNFRIDQSHRIWKVAAK